MKLIHLDLFSGIGGFSLALDNVYGKENVEHIFCEIDSFCREVLKKHWPNAPIYGDINNVVLDLETGISIMDLCENPAHTVNKKKEPPIRTGGRGVSRRRRENDSTEARNGTRNINNESVNIPLVSERKSSVPMGVSVPVAEKKSLHSSQLTIGMVEEQKKGKRKSEQDLLSTEVLSKEDFPKNINSSVITATTEHTDSVFAHTNDERPFILTGGFPCQSFSQAGRRKGTADARWLWPQMFRVIQLTKPEWCIAENVRGLTNWEGGLAFGQVLSDLESEGYSTQTFIIPAVAIGAPHRRDRVWFVAHRTGTGLEGGNRTQRNGRSKNNSNDTNPTSERRHNRSDSGKERQILHDQRASEKDKQKRQGRKRGFGATTTDASNDSPWNSQQRNDSAQRGSERSFARRETKSPSIDGRRSYGCRIETTGNRKNRNNAWNQNWLEVATRLCTLDDGLPNGLVRPRGWRNAALKAAGNAIVPQVAMQIMLAIKEADGGVDE